MMAMRRVWGRSRFDAGDRSVTVRVSVPRSAGDGEHVGLVSALTR
jgi:hypothetical protein